MGYSNCGSSCDEYPPSAGTSFNIVVREYDTRPAAFCADNGGNNDGSEFTLVNGNFQNAKKPQRGVEFTDAQPRNPQGLRHFEDENGGKVALLNPNLNGTLVGTSVSNGLRNINIVKEIF
ncbi:hypothetical protein DL762_002537 [Monosporascus cannonballus]|uniref:Uncharacterized protein n=1 Tax=Monosporascus cannonballus TaxID=155416 RepID=A0ABY0HDL3_9PEZI|nr:hypothetical protein DL762_002537 [Monosporascus cannonballus]RYP01360.1 hypothetical protein DL763_000170 [Monosporascus cannonballus]